MAEKSIKKPIDKPKPAKPKPAKPKPAKRKPPKPKPKPLHPIAATRLTNRRRAR